MSGLKPLLLVLTALALSVPVQARQFLVYVGTYTNAASRGIYVSRLDADTGKLSPPELAAELANPSYLAVSPDERSLYAANEAGIFELAGAGRGGAISAFAIDKTSGRLTLLNQVSSGGADPCHVSVDASGSVILAANYSSGSVISYLRATNGAIGDLGARVVRTGHGPNASRQTSAHAHFICADPSNRFALACDLGTDEVLVYPLDLKTGGLASAGVQSFRVPPGSGPRHLAFSADGKFVHVVNEMACTISTFSWDPALGELRPIETVSALPPDVTVPPAFTAAEILCAGGYVYVSLRGHDSISVLAADPATGQLKFLQNIPSGGKVPRGLGIDPTGRWLLAGNQNSDTVAEFSIDPSTGRLIATGQTLHIGAPVDFKFVSTTPVAASNR